MRPLMILSTVDGSLLLCLTIGMACSAFALGWMQSKINEWHRQDDTVFNTILFYLCGTSFLFMTACFAAGATATLIVAWLRVFHLIGV